MIKSIATLSKENGMPCMMMNNGLYHLSKNNWLVVLNDKIVKAELSADESNVWHDTCINLAGKDVRMVQYINMDDMNYVVVGLENEIIVSDLDSGVELFHKEMSSEDVTCALISKYNLIIGTNLGRILRINVRESKDVDTEICQEFKISKNIWAICEFQDFLVISVESGALEFWKNNNGSWNCMKRTESKFPGTCMHAISCDFLLITRFHGAIDIINRDLNLEITLGAHTAYISGISFDSKRIATISMDQVHLWGWNVQDGNIRINCLKTFQIPGYSFCGVAFKENDIILTAAGEQDFYKIDSSHFQVL